MAWAYTTVLHTCTRVRRTEMMGQVASEYTPVELVPVDHTALAGPVPC